MDLERLLARLQILCEVPRLPESGEVSNHQYSRIQFGKLRHLKLSNIMYVHILVCMHGSLSGSMMEISLI